jgi:hypothetical protein
MNEGGSPMNEHPDLKTDQRERGVASPETVRLVVAASEAGRLEAAAWCLEQRGAPMTCAQRCLVVDALRRGAQVLRQVAGIDEDCA